MILRKAILADAPTLAAIARIARATAMPWLPVLHSLEGDEKFHANRVVPQEDVVLAEIDDQILGFLARDGEWVDHLYIHPDHQGQGLGTAFIKRAQDRAEFLQLWVFERNTLAQAFYAKHGFVVAERTDGGGNEEKCPDVRMEWRGSRA